MLLVTKSQRTTSYFLEMVARYRPEGPRKQRVDTVVTAGVVRLQSKVLPKDSQMVTPGPCATAMSEASGDQSAFDAL